ncbi:hypothetical protein GN956_G16529 [Arapaima gigas]
MMTDALEQIIKKKELVLSFMETMEKGAKVLSEAVGTMFPVFSIAAPLVELALDNVTRLEADFMKEQF